MKKIFLSFTFLVLISLIGLISILSTIGIETKRFNDILSENINKSNNNINFKFNTIKFKIDLKQIGLFLETNKPIVDYRNISIPIEELKVYINFLALIKSDAKIEKISLNFEKMGVKQLKELSTILKPSNLTILINNRIKKGYLDGEVEIYFNKKGLIDNFISRGLVENLKVTIKDDLHLEKTDFTFFADNTDILLKNISSESENLKIKDGDIKIKLGQKIFLSSNFKTDLKYNQNLKLYKKFLDKYKITKNLSSLNLELNNNLYLEFDKTLKVKNFDFKNNGNIKKADITFENPVKSNFIKDDIKEFSIVNTNVETNFALKKSTINLSGNYSKNQGELLTFNLQNIIEDKLFNLKIDGDIDEQIDFQFLNYQKPRDKIANISLEILKKKNDLFIKKVNFIEGKNTINIKGLKLRAEKFVSLDEISVKTETKGKNNNDFSIKYGDKISISGKRFDANNLSRILTNRSNNQNFSNINKEIEINFSNVAVPFSESLTNFSLIGKIEKGKFVKISSKGNFGENKYLDIIMKNDTQNKKKYLEIYSDLTKPLLADYSFFDGLTGGKLLFSSTIEKNLSISNLKIENFKVVNAPGMVKLLSLADLGGLADLAEGEGISFDILDIKMQKTNELLKLNEILALGPSISVIMEGYQDSSVTSLKGTLVPAKTLNKIISKIPVIGKIVIPKDVGEGLFGISFKLKGPPGNIKTTINPIRTITPRFIQKIIEKNKNLK